MAPQGRRRHALSRDGEMSRRRSSSRSATATPSASRATTRRPRRRSRSIPTSSSASPMSIRAGPTAWSCSSTRSRTSKLKGVKFGPIYNGVALSDPRLEPVYEYLQQEQPAADHAHGHDLRPQRADRHGPGASMSSRSRCDYPDLMMILAHMGHPWYEDCIVVVAQAAQRLLRGVGALLPALAVLQHPDRRAGIQDHRQDLLRHRFPVRARRGIGRRACSTSTTSSRAPGCRG